MLKNLKEIKFEELNLDEGLCAAIGVGPCADGCPSSF